VNLWLLYEALIYDETNFLGVVRQSPSLLGKFEEYAVSTDAKPCAKIGKSLLKQGGSAVDAAIGTLICMGVALPNSLGLGGGCLMTIYDNITKRAIIIDGREEAPDYANELMFSADAPLAASRGPLSVGVPGELAAYWEAHQKFGRLKWADLFEGSIKMAEEGSPTVEHLAYALRDMSHAQYITPPLRQVLWNNKTNDYVAEGDPLIQPALAETLKRIRDNGVDEFYRGQTGFAFIDDLQKQGGKMTMDNLSKYKALIKNASFVDLNENLKVYTQPLPGSGIVLSIILRIMRDLGYLGIESPKDTFEGASLYYHHLAEAFKFAYAQRAGLEDKADDPIRMEKLIAKLESQEFIDSAVAKIKATNRTLPIEEYGGLQYFGQDHGTAHVSVIDGQGNSVAVTTSINLYFGSGLISPQTGIIYNDVMDDFVSANITNKFQLAPSKYNRIRPGRRPVSSMAPSVFVDGRGNPRLVIGASGGAKITSAIASVAMRNVFMNEDIKTAIDGPRIHHQFLPDSLWHESNFPPDLLASLVERGHKLEKITGRSSVVMALACDYSTNGTRKVITGNSDYRKGGSVDGV